MSIQRSVEGPAHLLSCAGEIALGRGDEELMSACREVLDQGAAWIVLDLTKVAYLDSGGVGALVACSKRAAERGAVMRLVVAPEGPVRRVLEATHLDRAFDVFESLTPAVRSIPR